MHCGGVDGDLVAAGLQERTDVVEVPHAAAHGEGHEDIVGGAGHHIEYDVAFLVRCGDVQEHQFVRALLVVKPGVFHRIARVADVHEVHAFDHAAVAYVKAGYDAFG